MITQAITTNWVWAGSARLSSHTNGSCDHYPPLAVSRVGSKSLSPGGPLRSSPSWLNSQELLLDTDTPHSRLKRIYHGGGPRLAAVFAFNFLFHDISNEFWNFFFKQINSRSEFFFFFSSLLGSKRDMLRYFITLMGILGDGQRLVAPGVSYWALIETGGLVQVAFHTAQQRILLSF